MKFKAKNILPFALIFGCDAALNYFSFFPSRTHSREQQKIPPHVAETFIKTPDGELLQCFFLKNTSSGKLVIYFHGNGGNIYQRIPELEKLASLGASVLGVGYRGYGKSTGSPSEKGIYTDGKSAYAYALDSLQYTEKDVYIVGRSLGTTVAAEIGVKSAPAGIILITPLTNARQYAKAHKMGPVSCLAGNSFDIIGKAGGFCSRALIIHGTKDEVIPYEMGKAVYENLNVEKTFIAIEGGDHNTLEYANPEKYWGAIQDFLLLPPEGSADR